MRQRTLGTSSLSVSVVSVGCNAFGQRIDAHQTHAVVDAAFDSGINFFDTADSYALGHSEELLGRALAGRRDQVLIGTKFGMDMQGRNGDDHGRRGSSSYIRTAVEASLRRLATDYIDLYQLHTPDPNTPIEETIGAMSELVAEGKVRAIGCSNFQAWQIVDASWRAKSAGAHEFVTAQNEYSLYNRTAEVELVPACLALGMGILPYFPLAYGLLTGKYDPAKPPPEDTRLHGQRARYDSADWDRIAELTEFATNHGLGLLEVAIGGLVAQPAVSTVIAGATRPEQVAANAAAAEWIPTHDEFSELAGIGSPTQSYTTYAP